ncbi:MAG: gatB [Candidatus Nomurabacteria bacterium]|nr:gatB [Candidatus Nomurabacteria bacterium]
MSNDYITTIGLEVHAELHTNSKMWCGCKNDPYEKKPNQNICEVCMAHPGTLPVPNKDAIKKVITVGLALGADIADFTEFDRKNYFYPDIPKGYQISQYKLPIVTGGKINGIEVTRIHLEEDTAKSTHTTSANATLVDYNRAGVPLMELVTEPVIHTAEDAGKFARELQRVLRYVGASEANMEMGQMRVEANISVSKDPNKFGTKCEVKNLNSFRSVEEAIKYEVARHIELIEKGEQVIQETRGWDENKQTTFSQRKKENAHDYRYFPDPDLPKLYLHKLFNIDEIKSSLPTLPKEMREKLAGFDLKPDTIDILIDSPSLVNYFNEVIKDKDAAFANLTANYLTADILGLLKKDSKEATIDSLPTSKSLRAVIEMIQAGELSSRGAKDLLAELLDAKEVDVKKLAEEKGLIQKNDPEALKTIVAEVISENPKQVADYKSGKEAMFMFFVGQCMKKSKGSGNPALFQDLLKQALK